jgi:SPP1 gp7 family putative phage head morphogenesis protein
VPEVLPFNLPPAEAIAFFRRKGLALSFAWQDIYAAEHARVFTVAKAMQVDVLEDIRRAVDRAIAEGTTLQDFRRELTPLLQQKGWWGRQSLVDPLTGKARTVQLGSPRRLETIYDTNLRTGYAAGRWQQIQRTRERRPYLRYVAILDSRTRPRHRAWHGTVLPADHPFWQTHFPPNGWRCRCNVQQLSDRDLERYGYEVSPAAPSTLTGAYTNPRTGETRHVPLGIDPGFDYNVGIVGEAAERMLADKIAAAAPDIRAAARGAWGAGQKSP